MTEDDARSWIELRFGSGTAETLAHLVAMVLAETSRQNLIAPSTVDQIWSRHVVDSAQLAGLAPPDGTWLDIGTGGGFPGLVVAVIRPFAIHLVEPRRLRAAFLAHCREALGLSASVTIHASAVERVDDVRADVISARAVAPPTQLMRSARHCATPKTRWILPRGRNDGHMADLSSAFPDGMFHVEQSVTDPMSSILVVGPR